jgi:exonuclease III
MDIRFGTWNIRSLYRIGSLKTVARELGKYKLDLMGVQEVRWEKGGTERAEDYTFSYGQGNGDHQLRTGFFVHTKIVSAVRRVEFISDRMSYIILRGRWCNIIFLNVHAPCEDKGDDVKDSFCEKLGRVFDQFPRYNMKYCWVISTRKKAGKISSNQQSEKRDSMKLVMTMELEY